MTETITDTETGEVFDVEYEEKMAGDVFPWLRGTEFDFPIRVGKMAKQED